ncbi:hypothetical protein MLD38_019833 [Melastoma candidum]|uniref:Uncharacterized protein n=1 Tax=Melastoma candidum TaxID=119954 RepID=A0ACB9QCY0_9MYRT|nr:hypothetical protein MLD38_019833 [Melastoma candidum]
MRAIFCGNLDFDARESELERLFRKYGKVERVDVKSGFAFIYMEDERDARDAIRGLDQIEFGRKGRRLRVEWTKQERGAGRSNGSRRSSNVRPSKTLFVINFDPYNTKTRDLEKHFEPYGKIVSVRIRRNFAFVQYEYQDDASKALDATHMSKLMDQVISVEYAVRDDDDDRKGGYSPRGRSPERGDGRRRSPSPYRRERGSPDYGRGPGPLKRERGSPDYGRDASPAPKHRARGTPDYGRDGSRSPVERERAAPERSPYGRENSGRGGNYSDGDGSPYGKRGPEPDYPHHQAGSPNGKDHGKRGSPAYERERSYSPAAAED